MACVARRRLTRVRAGLPSRPEEQGQQQKNYYTYESVGIACGMPIAALHQSGLGTLTHTPSPMKFLNQAFARPETERAYLLLVVGYPAADTKVPNISRKSLNDIASLVGDCQGDWTLEAPKPKPTETR